jgi:hypothetical protein
LSRSLCWLSSSQRGWERAEEGGQVVLDPDLPPHDWDDDREGGTQCAGPCSSAGVCAGDGSVEIAWGGDWEGGFLFCQMPFAYGGVSESSMRVGKKNRARPWENRRGRERENPMTHAGWRRKIVRLGSGIAGPICRRGRITQIAPGRRTDGARIDALSFF